MQVLHLDILAPAAAETPHIPQWPQVVAVVRVLRRDIQAQVAVVRPPVIQARAVAEIPRMPPWHPELAVVRPPVIQAPAAAETQRMPQWRPEVVAALAAAPLLDTLVPLVLERLVLERLDPERSGRRADSPHLAA